MSNSPLASPLHMVQKPDASGALEVIIAVKSLRQYRIDTLSLTLLILPLEE